MALPRIEAPKHDLVLPVSKKKIKYRPFLVKEQKILLQAMEMGNSNQVENAIEDILRACTFGDIDLDVLPVADIEYLIVMIRAKSVGEVIDVSYRCLNTVENEAGEKVECGSKIPTRINISDIEVINNEKRDYKIILSDSIGLIMRDIPYGEYREIMSTSDNTIDIGMNLLLSSIDSIFDGDTIYNRKDFTKAELSDFVEHLFSDDIKKIEEFTKNIPVIRKVIKLTCPKCGNTEEIVLQGVQDFLE